VFPEEFSRFLVSDARMKDEFLSHHHDLVDVEYWRAVQRRIQAGSVADVFPYPESMRFCRRHAPAA
jgi:isocitrate dehydrogenase kinase/phosphatase